MRITNKDIRTIDDLLILPILTLSEGKRYIRNTGDTSGAGFSFWTISAEDSEQ